MILVRPYSQSRALFQTPYYHRVRMEGLGCAELMSLGEFLIHSALRNERLLEDGRGRKRGAQQKTTTQNSRDSGLLIGGGLDKSRAVVSSWRSGRACTSDFPCCLETLNGTAVVRIIVRRGFSHLASPSAY